MPSPFPGMDPYIETPALWLEFHSNLASEIQGQLNRVLDPRYRAGLTSYVPLEAPVDLYRVEIRTTASRQLVTVMEILSPSNKRHGHEDALEYLRKRRALLRSSVHLIEIDLLRGGERPPLERPVPRAPYYVVLSRADRRPKVGVWPIQLADPLPEVPVPLLHPDPDVPLNLGAAVKGVYERCAYDRTIDYRQSPPPPALTAEEAEWAETLLRDLRRRSDGADGPP